MGPTIQKDVLGRGGQAAIEHYKELREYYIRDEDPESLGLLLRTVETYMPKDAARHVILKESEFYDERGKTMKGMEAVRHGAERPAIFNEFDADLSNALLKAVQEEAAELEAQKPWWRRIFR
jgi:hypothetical protein